MPSFLILAPEFPPERGGVQTYSWEVALELHRQGHQVRVLTRSTNPPDPAAKAPPFPVEPILQMRRYLDAPSVLGRARLMANHSSSTRDPTDCPAPPDTLATDQPPLIVLATNAAYAGLAADLKAAGFPLWVCIHGNDFVRPYYELGNPDLLKRLGIKRGARFEFAIGTWATNRLLNRSFPLAERVFANSRYTARRFKEIHPNAAPTVRVTGIGLAQPFLDIASHPDPIPKHSTSNAPGRVVHLLTVCRLVENTKNVAAVIDALSILAAEATDTTSSTQSPAHTPDHDFDPDPTHALPQWRYEIIGDGPLRGCLETLAEAFGIGDKVTFHGKTSDENLAAAYRRADLFIMTPYEVPMSFEGFGIVFLEANAYGLPVLATSVGGITDAVDPPRSGWFAESPLAMDIADELRAFLHGERSIDPEDCRAHARSHTWQAVVDRMLAIAKKEASGDSPLSPQ